MMGEEVGEIIRSTSMRWYERLTWRYQIPLRSRGYYHLAACELRAGDLFGVYRRQREEEASQWLWVYPEVLPLDRLDLPQLRPHGERRGGQRLFDDPTRLQTVRDYRPGDPLKRIDWKATARRQAVQTRVYEPASDLVAVVALNVSTLPVAWQGFYGDIFERAVSVAASLSTAWSESRRAGRPDRELHLPGQRRADPRRSVTRSRADDADSRGARDGRCLHPHADRSDAHRRASADALRQHRGAGHGRRDAAVGGFD